MGKEKRMGQPRKLKANGPPFAARKPFLSPPMQDVPPPYDPARDQLAFKRAWEKVAQLKADGKLKLMPPRSTWCP